MKLHESASETKELSENKVLIARDSVDTAESPSVTEVQSTVEESEPSTVSMKDDSIEIPSDNSVKPESNQTDQEKGSIEVEIEQTATSSASPVTTAETSHENSIVINHKGRPTNRQRKRSSSSSSESSSEKQKSSSPTKRDKPEQNVEASVIESTNNTINDDVVVMDVDQSLIEDEPSPNSTEIQENASKQETNVNENNVPNISAKPFVHDEKENKEKKVEKKSKPIRKRKWGTQKSLEAKSQILAISTDSLKNLISDVKPVPLSDVKLESSPEPEEVPVVVFKEIEDTHRNESERRKTSGDYERDHRDERRRQDRTRDEHQASADINNEEKSSIALSRKISIVNDGSGTLQTPRPPSPAKYNSTNILYITNLVRPFTILQLKGLLARTGKIVENGFWIDKIKSKCYVKYETEE